MKNSESSQKKALGDWAYLGIEKYFQKTIEYEEKVLADQDPEDLHQMRVGMRRLRSAVTGFAPALHLPTPMGNKPIGKMAAILGELRDLDVLQATLQQYQPQLPSPEQPLLAQALEALTKQRAKAFKQVKNLLQSKKYHQFKQSVTTWLQDPQYQDWADLPVNTVLPDLLLPCINQLLLHSGWWVGVKIDNGQIKRSTRLTLKGAESQIAQQGESLHDLRKVAKRVRYQMSLFTPNYGPLYQEYVQEVKQIQEVLGTIQDTLVLEEFLNAVLSSTWAKEGPKLAKLLGEQRYEAWKEWYKLQQRYLDEEVRQGLRQAVLSPLILVASGEKKLPADEKLPEQANLN